MPTLVTCIIRGVNRDGAILKLAPFKTFKPFNRCTLFKSLA